MRRFHMRRAIAAVFFGLLVFGPRAAPATVAEQRARLPPPADCDDLVEGVWRSHAWHPGYAEWNVFTLTIERDPDHPDRLTGSVTNEAWYGPKEEVARGPCEGRLQYLVSMDGAGRIEGNEIHFGGVGEWRLDEVYCSTFFGGYNLDQFAGVIDTQRWEFQSVNNDGGRFVDVATVFRRVACVDGRVPGDTTPDNDGPRVRVSPPAFYPPEQSSGCSCNP